MKKILNLFILILIFIVPNTYATDEIISSQMEALDLSSLITEGENYTQDVFPDIDLNELLSSAISGKVDNKSIFTSILSLFGDEVLSSISLLGSILIIIIIHSLLKNFTDNLNNGEGIGQITYYVQYILIVTLIMANFSKVISMIRESISNLVGFVNCLVPILLALMSATRQCNFCFAYTAINYIFGSVYCKYCNTSNFTYYIDSNGIRNNIKLIR